MSTRRRSPAPSPPAPAAVAALDVTAAAQKTAGEAAATAWAAVMAQHAKSDDAILMIRDTMWNLLGRVRRSTEMEQAFPGGVALYTQAAPHQQAMLIQVLQSRINSVPCPRWTDEARKEWVAQLEARRMAYEAALAAHRPVEAAAMVAEAAYRTAVRTAHIGLRALKRDLQTSGYTESQIHDVIPDASTASGGANGKKPTDPGTTPGNGTGTAAGPTAGGAAANAKGASGATV